MLQRTRGRTLMQKPSDDLDVTGCAGLHVAGAAHRE